MGQSVDTVVVGGGQAGLATSYHLSRLGREHVVLEQGARAGRVWHDDRWDSFTLVSPNWATRMPGAEYAGAEPDGYMPRDELVAYFEAYVARFNLPVRYGARVTAVEPHPDGRGYLVHASGDVLTADNVVVATGLFQQPRIPAFAGDLPDGILQLASGQYRNPQALPPGAVLVAGTGQSGCQIAEELYQSGRKVYLCVGSTGRVPRRYRGRDIFGWLVDTGFLSRTADRLPSPKARFAGNPHVSGKGGGRNLNLHQFARDGVVLLGRALGARGATLEIAPDLKDNLARADRFEAEILANIDRFIDQSGLHAPAETLPALHDGYRAELLTELDLAAAGVTTIIWALSYTCDFRLVRQQVCDGDGYPLQSRGVTGYPGLYFVGLPWLTSQQSGLLLGVGEDAAYVAAHIAARSAAGA